MSAATGRLTDEVVVAIGCGTPDGQTNNGLAAARAFLAEGARVGRVARRPPARAPARRVLLEEDPQVADRLTEAVADVVDDAQLAAAIDAAAALFGPPTVLHYNVGIVVNGGVEELEVDAFRRALDINLTGAFAAMKHVVPHMRAAGRGSIITVASTGGMRWMGYDYPAYAASKAALIELTNSVGLRYAREGIRANSISPGLIETPLIRTSITGHYGSVEEMLAARHAASPTGHMGQPEDVGAAAVFLASQESRYINATCVPVDGGLIHTTSVAAAQH
jgi:NAD(P)-dependent dehydrogenase (short-subunit alcohol dehydrogenase family)